MENKKLKDSRFKFLIELGFNIFEVNNQLDIWCDGLINCACDEYLIEMYKDNLITLKEKEYDEEIILYLFFVHSECFAISNEVFKNRIDMIENELGPECASKIFDDFWEVGESKIFSLVGIGMIDQVDWINMMKNEKEKMKNSED